MTRAEWNAGIARLTAAFPQREIGAATIAVYREKFIGLDGALFAAAVEHCLDTCDWFPTISQLTRAADEIAAQAHGVLPTERAWEAVLSVARGWYDGQSIRGQLPPAVFDALQRIGGIRPIANADDYGLQARRKEFVTAYEPVFRETVQAARGLPLDGAARITALDDGRAA